MRERAGFWDHALAVIRPSLLLASPDFLDEIADRLHDAGIQQAVQCRDTATLFDWLVGLLALQGVSDAAAFAFDAEHGGITFAEIARALDASPSCPRLACHWTFSGCGYRKSTGTCAEPQHRRRCPLPRQDLRKGGLNVMAYGLFLFVRDVCASDLVGWIDNRLAAADRCGGEDRAARRRQALLEPLAHIAGTGRKLWSMILADLLLAGDPDRERWVETGASLIAVDSLVHNHLHRTGILRRLGAEHAYGDACYGPNGCAHTIEGLSARIDARAFNPTFPATFPRFVQHAIWHFCAAGGRGICNGNRIDDRAACRQRFCAAAGICDRRRLSSALPP